MTDISKVLKNVIFKEQVAYTVDFNKAKNNITYSQGSQFKSFFKNLSLTDEEIMTICRHCIDMIISRYGIEAYATQYFEYDDFKFIVRYVDFGYFEDETVADSRICSVFWSFEEYELS